VNGGIEKRRSNDEVNGMDEMNGNQDLRGVWRFGVWKVKDGCLMSGV
jgi:hypothetical protein